MSWTGSKNPSRPVLNLPWTPLQVILGITGLIGTCLLVAILLYYWSEIPAVIPIHFGASGRPDGWGSKQTLIYLAATGVVLYLMMFVLSRYPHLYNYLWSITEANAETQYRIASTFMIFLANVIIWLFTYMVWQSIQTALGQAQGMGSYFLVASMFLSFGSIVVYLFVAGRARNITSRK